MDFCFVLILFLRMISECKTIFIQETSPREDDSPVIVVDSILPDVVSQPLTVATNSLSQDPNGAPLTSPLEEIAGPATDPFDPDFDPGASGLVVEDDDEEEESSGEDWQANVDVEIGWWRRQRNRTQQQRRRTTVPSSRRGQEVSIEHLF